MNASKFTMPTLQASIPVSEITGLILAGGRGSRMGGIDKGLVLLNGRPMVAHVVERLRPQVSTVLINANRNLEQYRAHGFPVVSDQASGFLGPLAGMASGLQAAATLYVVTVPCDSPLIGSDLVARLAAALTHEDADIAVAHDGERPHPVFLLVKRALHDDLAAFLAGGGRKIDLWFARHRVAVADFSDSPQAFLNVNDPDERAALESKLLEATS